MMRPWQFSNTGIFVCRCLININKMFLKSGLTLQYCILTIMLTCFWWGCHLAVLLTSHALSWYPVWYSWLSWCALSFCRVCVCVSRNSWLSLSLAMCSKSFVCLSDFALGVLIWKKLSSFAFTVSFLLDLWAILLEPPNVSLAVGTSAVLTEGAGVNTNIGGGKWHMADTLPCRHFFSELLGADSPSGCPLGCFRLQFYFLYLSKMCSLSHDTKNLLWPLSKYGVHYLFKSL